MAVKLKDLEDALHYSSDGVQYGATVYVNRESGELWFVSEVLGIDQELPDDLDDDARYAVVPGARDLDLGQRLVWRFVNQHAEHLYDAVAAAFSRRGAWRRYKDLLDRHGKLDAWHAYEEEQTRLALKEWCETEGIELDAT